MNYQKLFVKTKQIVIGEFKKNPIVFTLLTLVLLAAFFVRVYRIDQLLGFYFDQGRDALVIWKFIYEGNPFLIGPTTGIEGIFRGPWYYWLITPAYLIGGGNPIYPSFSLSFTTIIAIAILYYLGKESLGKKTGFLAVIIASFSYYLVLASRWLSNPTPMLLISMLLVWGMYLVTKGRAGAWYLVAFSATMAIQFGSAAEIFYLPAILIFTLWQYKNLPGRKVFIISLLLFFLGFIPQILFDLLKGGVISNAIKRFLVEERSFKASFWEVLQQRIELYKSVFLIKIWPSQGHYYFPTLLVIFTVVVAKFRELFKSKIFVITTILLSSVIIGMLFFQGNFGNIYDYYFTGYYLVFVLWFSILLGSIIHKNIFGWILVIPFMYLFLSSNLFLVRNYIVAGVDRPTTIAFGNQKLAIGWIYQDSKDKEFNVDVYVPPVIPYAYDFLFKWYPTTLKLHGASGRLVEEQVPLLYTLYEVDPPHPERLDLWLKRQETIAKVEKQKTFGGITVQRRLRIK